MAQFDLLGALVEASGDGSSGTLTLSSALGERIRFGLREATLVGLEVPERLLPGAVLVRAGKLSQSVLGGLTVIPGEDRFEVAVRSGVVTAREAHWALKMAAIEALAEAMSWDDGSYAFDGGSEPLPVTVELSITRWILELILRSRDRASVTERLGPMDSAIERTEKFTSFGALGLTADADAIVAMIDGRRSAADILRKARSDEFAVMKLLAAMRTLGLTKTAIEASPFPEAPAEESRAESSEIEPPIAELPLPPEIEPEPIPIPLPPEPVVESPPEPDGRSASGPFEVPIPPEPPPPREIPLPLFALTAPDEEEQPAEVQIEPASEEAGTPAPSRARRVAGAVVAIAIAGAVFLVSKRRTAAPPHPPAEQLSASIHPRVASSSIETAPKKTPALAEENRAKPSSSREAVPTPTPVVASGNAISKMADKGDRQSGSPGRFRYAIQLELACEESTVTRALRADPERKLIWIARSSFRGRTCYRVLWGRYRTLEEARAAREHVPSVFREGANRPAVVSLGSESKSRK